MTANQTISRRSATRIMAGAGALALSAGPKAFGASNEPIRLGFLTVRSGPLAAGGRQMEEGLKLCLEQNNYTFAGRKIKLFIGDTAGEPAVTKSRTQELVERDHVQAIIGPLAAFEALAIDSYIRKMEMPIISPSAAADNMTQRKVNPWFVRAVGTASQGTQALGAYAAKVLGYKRVATISDAFAFGYEMTGGFQATFEDNGGQVVQKLWPPLKVADYGSYIAQIDPKVDAVFAGFAGSNGERFLSAYQQYGLKGRIPVISNMTTVDEGILRYMGAEALGVVSSGWYSAAIDTPENKAFVAAVRKRYHADPGYYTNGAYTAALFLKQALETVHGDIEDKTKFMSALRHVDLPHSPRGPVRLDKYGNPIMNIYIRKVEKQDGRLMNTVIKTYPDVSQFWTYDPQKFLSHPVYSRDYPPATHLVK